MPVQASVDTANLPEPVDVVLVVDTYHHIGNRTQHFANLRSLLRPTGRLAIVDFKADLPVVRPRTIAFRLKRSRKNSTRLVICSWRHFNSCLGTILPRLPKA